MLGARYSVVRKLGIGTFGKVIECIDTMPKHPPPHLQAPSVAAGSATAAAAAAAGAAAATKTTGSEDHEHGNGNGHSGDGGSANNGDRGTKVAVKVVRAIRKYSKSAVTEAKILEAIQKHVKKTRRPSHCVELTEYFKHHDHMCLVFEPLGCSLLELIKANNRKGLPLAGCVEIGRQVLQSLAFLHSMKLIHTDLKVENVLFCRDVAAKPVAAFEPADWRIKVIDFGGATYDDEHKSRIINTRQYRSLEVILGLGWSYPSDIWSTGCIVMEVLTGGLFFSTHDNAEHIALMQKVLGRIPTWMSKDAAECRDHFDRRTGHLLWPHPKTKESSRKFVAHQRSLDDILTREAKRAPPTARRGAAGTPPGAGAWELFGAFVRSLLRLDPFERATAEGALKDAVFADPRLRL